MELMASSSNSPCAACKFLRRKCLPECVFAPYFPPDQPQRFMNVHRVFGASNVTKFLNDLHPQQREDAVNSLAYEAEMRLRDPVFGCVGVISVLQHQLNQLQMDLSFAKSELYKYQSLGITNHGQLVPVPPPPAAMAAAPIALAYHHHYQQYHNPSIGIGIQDGGVGFHDQFYHHQHHHHHQLPVIRTFGGDANSLYGMNVSVPSTTAGQPSQAAARNGHRSTEPS